VEVSLSDCVFCKIVAGQIPAKKVAESEKSLAFFDVSPRQPLHVLVVPKNHHDNVADLAFSDPEALVDLIQLGSKIANDHAAGSFRLTFNTGSDAGQTVFHAHGHITSKSLKETSGN